MSRGPLGSQALAARMLTDAYEFVRSGWCQGAAGLDECGRPIDPASAFARKWSALGALERAWRRSPEPPGVALDGFQRAKLALTAAANDVPQAWNDRPDRRVSEVLSALSEAIRLVGQPVAVPPSALDDPLDDLDDPLDDLDAVGPLFGQEELHPALPGDKTLEP